MLRCWEVELLLMSCAFPSNAGTLLLLKAFEWLSGSPSFNFPNISIRTAPKVMPPILLCWPVTSEVRVGGMAVEAEPSHQYPVPCCCCVTDGSRGAVWQNGVWHGSADEAKRSHWISSCRKKWHPLTFSDACWTFMVTSSGCERREAVGGAFQQWQQWHVSHVLDGYAQLSHHKMKRASTSSSTWICWWWWLCWKNSVL